MRPIRGFVPFKNATLDLLTQPSRAHGWAVVVNLSRGATFDSNVFEEVITSDGEIGFSIRPAQPWDYDLGSTGRSAGFPRRWSGRWNGRPRVGNAQPRAAW
jgi:hypothetical protein